MKALLAVVDPLTAGYAVLLLCGISPYELTSLHSECFDKASNRINIPGANQRELEIGPSLWQRLDEVLANIDNPQKATPIGEVEFRLVNAARTAQITDPTSINALALWHSYVVYLVRQGIDDLALTNRVGPIHPDIYQALTHFAPPDGNRPLSSIDFIHPALVEDIWGHGHLGTYVDAP